MFVFAGNYELSLDDKNRVVLPLGLRKCIKQNREETLAKGFMLAPGDGNERLELFPTDEFEQHVRTLRARYLPEDIAGQNYLRRLTASATPIELDRQHRFIIPEKQTRAAGIDRDVYFVGATTKIEIWPTPRWEAWQAEHENMTVPAPSRHGERG
jgi:MraZ protein